MKDNAANNIVYLCHAKTNITMKRIITTLACAVLIASTAFAQASIGAGYLSSTEVVKSGNSSTQRTPLNGFYVGMGYTVPIAAGINFTPGVYFGMAAKSNATSIFGLKIEGKQQDTFINVPLHFSFGADLGSGLRFFAYGGPSASFALTSKIVSGSTTYDRLQDNDSLQRFDIMLGAGVGLQFNDMVRFQVGYDFGMLNRYTSDNITVTRNQLTAGLAFLF